MVIKKSVAIIYFLCQKQKVLQNQYHMRNQFSTKTQVRKSKSSTAGRRPQVLVAVEWLGHRSVEALRFRFATEELGGDGSDGRPWRRLELRPRVPWAR